MNDDTTQNDAGQNNSQNDNGAYSSSSTGGAQQDDGVMNDVTSPSVVEFTKLKMDLTQANERVLELTDTAKRALADLSNYRRLVEQERVQYAAFANSSFIREILPIADNFARSFEHVPPETANSEWYKGVIQIEKQLVNFLKKQGVEEIPSAVGMPMDSNLHEPLLAGPGEKDIVLEEFEKGYTLGGQVLRPAKVKVGNGEAA